MDTSAHPGPHMAKGSALPGAHWIGGPGHAFCRREFVLDGCPKRAVLRIVADPHSYAIGLWQVLPSKHPYDNWLVGGSFLKYRVYLNGIPVAVGPFRPLEDGIPVLHEFAVEGALQAGANALAVLSRGEARGFALALDIFFADGRTATVVSDGRWRRREGNSVYRTVCWETPGIDQFAKGGPSPGEYPEHIDGWAYPQGWKDPGFDDGDWASAESRGLVTGAVERPGVSPYRLTPCRPVMVRSLGEGNHLVDFGRAVFGGIELSAPAGGGAVEVRLAEELQPNGHARYQLRTENCFQEIWTFPPDSEPLHHLGARMFRYAEVVGWRGTFDADCLVARAIHAPFDETASAFSCSDPALVRVWEFCKVTVAHTTADVFTDCLTRERLAYEADGYITMLTHFATEGSGGTARRTLEYLTRHPSCPCEWWQFFVPLFYEYHMHSGDEAFLARHYPFLRDHTTFHHLMEGGIIRDFPRTCIVDWPEFERDGFVFGPGNAVANAMAYWDLTLLRSLAEFLGKQADAEECGARAAELREGFNRLLFDEGTGLYVDSIGSGHSSLHANLYALRFGLAPADRVGGVLDYVKRRGLACSVFTAQFYLEALFLHGEDALAVQLMTADSPRSWLGMIRRGAVATTESWLDRPKKNMSWAHPWATAPANVIVRHLFGLRPTQPGWREYAFDPRPGGLDWGELRLSTPRGPVTASFARDGRRYRVNLSEAGDGNPDESVVASAAVLLH